MGLHIIAKNKYGEEISYYHFPVSEKDRPLHRALGVNGITVHSKEQIKPYSLGDLLHAKSHLMTVTGTLDQQDFLDSCISSARETRQPIYITFK